MRKFFSSFVILAVLFSLAVPTVLAAETELSEDIVILYTNDIHTYIDGPLSYDVIAAIKADLQTRYRYVLLVDAGDHVQGAPYGSMDKGETIISLMNAAGYEAATLGNHEFDYGMAGCMNVLEWADYPYLSCNFYHVEEGVREENVLDSFRLFECGGETVAFVGITTPESIQKSTPAYFQDENGNYIYGISGGADGAALYADVQAAVDEAKAAGATKVIALGHLGIDASSEPWTSVDTIAHVSGLDAFIDGHSHSVVEGQTVTDRDGRDVLLTQTGQYFDRIGIMVIDAETGGIATDFIEYDETAGTLASGLYTGTALIRDEEIRAIKEAWIAQLETELGKKIGSTELVLDNYDEDGNRLVRSQETNTGDFAADALYYLFDNMGMDVDVAVMNGGGVRNTALTGDLTYLSCKAVHTFGNVACLRTVTGQQLLDALEWGARSVGEAEVGGFLQVSGLTYSIDPTVPNTIRQDEQGNWAGGPTGQYRVYDVRVYDRDTGTWEPLDLTAEYNVAGYNYTLRDLGDGYCMFSGSVNVLDYVMEDYMVLANYIQGFENGVVGASNSPLCAKHPGLTVDYSTVSGSGRIVIEARSAQEETNPKTGDAGMALCLCLAAGALWTMAAMVKRKKL